MAQYRFQTHWVSSLVLLGALSACATKSKDPEESMGATDKLTSLGAEDEGNAVEGSEGLDAESSAEASADKTSRPEDSEEDLLGDPTESKGESPAVSESTFENSTIASADSSALPSSEGLSGDENLEKMAQKAAEDAGIPLNATPDPSLTAPNAGMNAVMGASAPAETSAPMNPVASVPSPAVSGAQSVGMAASQTSAAAGAPEVAAKLSTLKWVGYHYEEAKGLLTVEILNTLPIDYEVFAATDRRRESGFLFRFYQSRLSHKLKYALDSSEFCSPISAISMHESQDGGFVDVFVKHAPQYREFADQGQLVEGALGSSLQRGSLRLVFQLPQCEKKTRSDQMVVKDHAVSLLANESFPLAKQALAEGKSPVKRVGLNRLSVAKAEQTIAIQTKIKQRPHSNVDRFGLPESFDRTLARRNEGMRSSLHLQRSALMAVAADEANAVSVGNSAEPENVPTETVEDESVAEPSLSSPEPSAMNAAAVSVPSPPPPPQPAAEPAAARMEAPVAPAEDVVGQVNPEPVRSGGYTGKAVVLDFYDAPLSLVLASLKEQTGHTYIYTEAVGQIRVTVHFHNVPWDEALEAILQTYGLESARIGESIVRIDKISEITQTKAARDQAERASSTQVLVYPLNHAVAKDVVPRLKELLGEGVKIAEDDRTNKIVIEASKKSIAKAKEIIRRLDTETRQVEIASRIVEVQKNQSNFFGVSWLNNLNFDPGRALGFGTLNFPNSLGSSFAVDPGVAKASTTGVGRFRFGSLNKFIDLDLLLKMEEKKGTTNVLQSNRVLVLDGQKATILSGSSQFFRPAAGNGIPAPGGGGGGGAAGGAAAGLSEVQFNLSLEVTPQVTALNSVIMKLLIKSDTPGDPSGEVLASKNTRTLDTQMVRNNGDTGVIGGIYDTNRQTTMTGIPFLSDIPILGALFRSTSTIEKQTELLIMVTPTIIPGESNGSEEDVAEGTNLFDTKDPVGISQSRSQSQTAKF